MITSITRVPADFTGKEEVVIVPLLKDGGALKGPARKLDTLCRSAISEYLDKWKFSCESGESMLSSLNLPKAPAHLLLLGLGEKEALTAERIAKAGGTASQAVKNRGIKTCHLLLGEPLDGQPFEEYLHPFLRGFLLAQYAFAVKAKPDEKKGPTRLVVMSNDRKVSRAIRTTEIVVEHILKVRDLVNTPPNTLTPSRLAAEASKLAKRHGLECRVMGPREIEKLKMGGLTAVTRGSREEPRLVVLHYNRGKAGGRRVCLVGKGVTFDSGGISIKPWHNMHEMKGDMAGGAVVLGVITAASRLRLPLEIVGIIPCVENLPDGSAFRPGDIVQTYSGKTIEIISTDAEGRVILSDALAYARQFKPKLIVDVATLTGAVAIALGTRIAGVMGNSQPHIDRFIGAGRRVGELAWQLPLDPLFSQSVKGDISDYKNYSGKEGSTITAAALLAEFVDDTPWIHLDIAGTFWSDGSAGPHLGKGATGYGVDLAIRFLEDAAANRELI